MPLSSDIREYGLSLGYDAIGFTDAESFPIYQRELTERREMYDWSPGQLEQWLSTAEPATAFPEGRSIVVAVYGYYRHAYPDEMVGKVGRLYQSMGGIPQLPLHGARHRLFREFLEKSGCRVGRGRTAPPPRLSAARAGVTTFGKNCFAFAGRMGSFIAISTFLVDAELDCDAPTLEVRCPEDCTLCIDACPTGALYEPLKMDPRRCIARNSYANEQPVTPMELRRGMDSWVFGCDVCQEVCPRNRARLKLKLPPSAYLEMLAGDLELETLLAMTDESFSRVGSLLNYITDKRLFQRNAAVALGNRGDTASVPALERAMDDPEEIVRGHAAWALGEIGGTGARRVLEKCLSMEASGYVRDEIGAALGSHGAAGDKHRRKDDGN